jgi:inward rectifier potassium channel
MSATPNTPPQTDDPGLGKRAGVNEQRAINPDGTFNIRRYGLVRGTRDFYQWLIRLSWGPFLLAALGSYVLANLLFALLYMAIGLDQLSSMDGDELNGFLRAFYFSCQTFTTVGYGFIAPVGHGAAIVAAFEAFAGLMFFSILTGLVYGRFSKPVPRLLFSKTAVIAPYEGGTGFMFRVANARNSEMMEIETTVILMILEEGPHGQRREYYRLDLETSKITFLPLNWTVVHPITPESPLWGKSSEDLVNARTEIMVLMKGFDENYGREIHARYSYTGEEIEVGRKFRVAYETAADGVTEINVNDIHLTDPAELPMKVVTE